MAKRISYIGYVALFQPGTNLLCIMKKIKHILLVFDNAQELEVLELNLIRNGFETTKSYSLQDAVSKTQTKTPDLIVISTSNVQKEIEDFSKQANMKYVKKTVLPSLVKLNDYLDIQTPEYVVIRGLSRSKEYRDNEIIFFVSAKKLN